jgi:CubicO group peptidase (beta-lactamase class C family)
MKYRRRFVFSVAWILLVAVVRADDVDEYVKAAMEKHHIPGVSLAVIRGGAVVKAEGHGLADIEHNIPAHLAGTPETGT